MPDFSSASLQVLDLSNNNFIGTAPQSLTSINGSNNLSKNEASHIKDNGQLAKRGANRIFLDVEVLRYPNIEEEMRSKVDKFNSALKYHLPATKATKGVGLEVLVDAKEKLMQTAPISIDCEWSKERLKRMMSLNGSGLRNVVVKKKNTRKGSQKIPMLDSKDLWMDKC
ncbi:hypothetical protein Tco_1256455 [Tanacetum coccineum]